MDIQTANQKKFSCAYNLTTSDASLVMACFSVVSLRKTAAPAQLPNLNDYARSPANSIFNNHSLNKLIKWNTIFTTRGRLKSQLSIKTTHKNIWRVKPRKIIFSKPQIKKKTTIRQGTFCLIDSIAQCICFVVRTQKHSRGGAAIKGKIPVMRFRKMIN